MALVLLNASLEQLGLSIVRHAGAELIIRNSRGRVARYECRDHLDYEKAREQEIDGIELGGRFYVWVGEERQ